MANHFIKMSLLKQIIRLRSENISTRKITEMLGMSRTTVIKYLGLIKISGLTFSELLELADNDLEELFIVGKIEQSKHVFSKERFPFYLKELSRVGVSLRRLWQEDIEGKDGAICYAQFCKIFNVWNKQQDVTMHLAYKAGEKVFVDFAGKKLIIVDKETGEIKKVEVYVATLGYSHYTYVEAVNSQKKEDFLTALQHTLEYFEGVPETIVPDNLKAAVDKASRYDPKINISLQDFAWYYQTTITPARVRKPQDKALVENAVNNIYRMVYAPLRNTLFHSLEELNKSIAELLDKYNRKCFQRKQFSRRDLFEQTEKQSLRPLPVNKFEFKMYYTYTVPNNYHVYLREDKHYYSVPFALHREKVQAIITQRDVSIYHKGERIAYHYRSRKLHGYTTVKEHMSEAHRQYTEWNKEKYLSWAASVGEATHAILAYVFEKKPYEQQAYNSCKLLFGLVKKAGKERVENACKRAIQFGNYHPRTIQEILEKNLDKASPEEALPQDQHLIPYHGNIRGKEYYQ